MKQWRPKRWNDSIIKDIFRLELEFWIFFFGLNFTGPTGLGICDVDGITMWSAIFQSATRAFTFYLDAYIESALLGLEEEKPHFHLGDMLSCPQKPFSCI